MSVIEFWQQSYLVALRLGTPDYANQSANDSVAHLQNAIKGQSQQPSPNAGTNGNQSHVS